MARIQNPLVPAEIQARAAKIASRSQRVDVADMIPAIVLVVVGALMGSVAAALILPSIWIALVLAFVRYRNRSDQAFLTAHPDLTLSVPEHVRIAYLRFSADANAISAADVPITVRADVDAARETAQQLLVACHSDRPEDPDEARRIQDASMELMRLTDEADELHTSVRQRTEAISARTDMIDGRDTSEILAQARDRSLSAATEAVTDETKWLTQHLDAIREGDPLDQQD